MAATHLTARFCASAKPKTGKDGRPVQTGYPDDDPRGLELRVSAEGRKVWTFRYRTLAAVQRRINLGTFVPGEEEDEQRERRPDEPELLTLKAARREARRIRALVEAGGDPAVERQQRKEKARAETLVTFNDLADAYIADSESGLWAPRGRKKRPRTMRDEKGSLDRHVRPALGKLPIEAVDRKAVKRLLAQMKAKGIGAQTNRAHAVVRQVFAYAITERERVENNPAIGLGTPAGIKRRSRTASDEELKLVWEALMDPSAYNLPPKKAGDEPRALYLSRPMAILLQLSAILLQRRQEVAGMALAELNLTACTWLIPAERAKNHTEHLVPLPPRAVELIKEAIQIAREAPQANEKPSPYVFPGHWDRAKHVRPDSVTHSLRDVCASRGITGLTVHDLRRTGSTAMTSERLNISPFIRSLVLSHTADSGGGAVVSRSHYDANSYVAEKRRALEAWERLLRHIVGEAPMPTNVTPIKAAG
jgi:integrase